MNIVEVSEKEYIEYAYKHPDVSFYQTVNWGKFKRLNGWEINYIVLKHENNIIAGSMILSKRIPVIEQYIFYACRGFLLDYNDYFVLSQFTTQIKAYLKKKRCIFIKIDPNILHLERNGNYEINEKGINNGKIIEVLKELGYIHIGFTMNFDGTQPRWSYRINLKEKNIDDIFNNFNSTTKRKLKKSFNKFISVRELKENELDIFNQVMEHTCDRRQFLFRGNNYFKNMYNELIKDNMIKIMISELDINNYMDSIEKEISNSKNENDTLLATLAELKTLKENWGSKIVLSSALFITFGNEVLYLYGGGYKEHVKYNGQYLIQWEMIKYAKKENYDYYNFGGISGDNNKDNPLYGLWYFKHGFGGEVTEYIGEFDLVINKPLYLSYKIAYSLYSELMKYKI